ncbi:MAG: YihY/virulence factor BrkB family protein [Lachnospiraceae bacterium]|jgi:membrane protein|nr:YihY/virulence factor BrkB family protein [Lachnospiraceae bacterium]MCI1726800.1 YihY/virulence factor BrkB family protein [Lachnospiraceae bacterium]
MFKKIIGGVKAFGSRMMEDHMGAYSATCAYFLMLSFIPFIMIMLAVIRLTPIDQTAVMNAMITIVPAGLKDYVSTIINEVYTKSYAIVPISVIILVWSASKFFHALTNGLNVISRVKETRNWFYIRFRSMILVLLLMVGIFLITMMVVFGHNIQKALIAAAPAVNAVLEFFMPFRSLIGYVLLILAFVLAYKFLPNRKYTFRSQLPGALIVATVWMMFAYFLTLYYSVDKNFATIYGNLTGVVLAMIWLYFCMYFVLVGAELNRVIFEDPEGNVIVSTIQDVKEASAIRKEALQAEIERQKIEATGEIPKAGDPKRENKANNGSLTIHEDSVIDLDLVRKGVEEHKEKLREEENE